MFSKTQKKYQKLEIAVLILLLILSFLFFSIMWVMSVWADLDVNEILFHLKTPLAGAGNGMITQYITHSVIPTIIVVLLYIACTILLPEKPGYKTLLYVFAFIIPLTALSAVVVFWNKVGIGKYIIEQTQNSPFIEDNYVDAADVTLTFPEKKRNLIYIYLESMETTYADKPNGGGFDFNCIPELTELALNNECFAGSSGKLNGGYVMPGTNFTMGGLFAQTSGLPLKLGISDAFLDDHGGWLDIQTQTTFFSGVTALGDILESEGYEQEILFGSDAVFGGRELYYSQHGNYKIMDYKYALDNGWIPENYYVFWGYEDEKLFENARNELIRLSEQDKPFNLSFLTVDTHFEDGYVCHLCKDEFGDNQYANVMACSSRQIYDFVEWIKQQDFYDNTTIIISGDHTTMDSDFCDNIPKDYERKTYTAIINPYEAPVQPDKTRVYTTLDNFPTTLGALGVKIEGNRLGLGTNLFSDEPTLAELYGIPELTSELAKKSKFMTELSNVDTSSEQLYLAQNPNADIALSNIDESGQTISLYIKDFNDLDEELSGAQAVIRSLSSDGTEHSADLSVNGSGLEPELSGTIDTGSIDLNNAEIIINATGKSGIQYQNIATVSGNLYLNNLDYYLDYLQSRLASGNYTILMTANGDISMSLSDSYMQKLQSLGIKTDMQNIQDESYYAVITQNEVTEEASKDMLEKEGYLVDGSPYSIVSCGESSGKDDICSIVINGGDHSINRRGLNIVLYNHQKGTVEDAVCFNTNYGLEVSRTPKRKFISL